jgi:hypothetical protein
MRLLQSYTIPFPVQSFDHTHNISKRTRDYDTGPEPERCDLHGKHHPKHVAIQEEGLLISMGANGQIDCVIPTKSTGKDEVKDMLFRLKRKCDDRGAPYPTWFCVDDVRAQEKTIKDVFPNADVVQDVKHLVNRLVEQLCKSHPLYGRICEKIHGAVGGDGKQSVIDRNGQSREVSRMLRQPQDMINKLNQVQSKQYN